MLIAAIIALCVLILVLAFLFPRLSRHPQNGVQRGIGLGGRAASKAPGHWLSKPFSASNRAVTKSGSAGRKGRRKMPF
jgi:hypothetical protein